MLHCPWGSGFKEASDLLILSSPTVSTYAGKSALEPHCVAYSSILLLFVYVNGGGVQVCCLQ